MKRTKTPRNLAELVKAAQAARLGAHAPYSGFKVGAALLTAEGLIVTGCNIENASFGLTMCAERIAIFKAVSEGLHDFVALAVVTNATRLTPPCGPCRQIAWEFCGDIVVHIENLKGRSLDRRVSELLPLPFDGKSF
ncbi:MAG TPA: cytidine deaminase [Vicinamibacteria bacterium]|nr:cytidine deaminase [Vicinamibacteria bacterium]